MATLERRARLEIGLKVGCDERMVLAVLNGKKPRYPAVEKAIRAELKKRGIVLGEVAEAADSEPPAAAEG